MKKIFAVLTMAAVLTGIAANPASAAQRWNEWPCSPGLLCTYSDPYGFVDPKYNYVAAVNVCVNWGYPMDNNVSGYSNQTPYTVSFFTGANCTGLIFNHAPGWAAVITSPQENNTISSHRLHY